MAEDIVSRLVLMTGQFNSALDQAVQRGKNLGRDFTAIGQKLTVGLTLPLTGIGVASIKMATDFNKAMANVATLIPGNTERVNELKNTVQAMAAETGKSTDDLAGGLYEVVSAFGDTAASAELLSIAARSSVAGVAETKSAIGLLSAVTKGYGDTSVEATKKAADLAFQTVKLGQTTFPELASSMGRVIPLAAALGITQEELFGTMATLTGVTGGTAEVTTQLRATYQAFLKPTKEMAEAINSVARELIDQGKVTGPIVDEYRRLQQQLVGAIEAQYELEKSGKASKEELKRAERVINAFNKDLADLSAGLGTSVVDALGFQGALQAVSKEADGNSAVLAKMFGSVEALGSVLALTGSQADTLTQKTEAMSGVSGIAEEAFREQAEGINKAGFTMEQFTQKMAVVSQKIGDALIPSLLSIVDAAMPVIDFVTSMIQKFSEFDPAIQTTVIAFTAAFAAAGPILVVLGMFMSAIAVITAPMLVGGAIIVGLVAGVALLVANWEMIREKGAALWKGLMDVIHTQVIGRFNAVVAKVQEVGTLIVGALQTLPQQAMKAGGAFVDEFVKGISSKASAAVDAVKAMVGKVRDYLPFSPAKEGPLSDLDKSGEAFGEVLAEGIYRGAGKPVDAVNELADRLHSEIDIRGAVPTEDGQFRGPLARTDTGFLGGMQEALGSFVTRTNDSFAQGVHIAEAGIGAMNSAIDQFSTDVVAGEIRSLGDVFQGLKEIAVQSLEAIAKEMIKLAMIQAITGIIGGGLSGMSAGNTPSAGGQSFLSGVYGSNAPKFAAGGAFIVGGPMGTDRTGVNIRASRGEEINVLTPAQQQERRGGFTVNVFNSSGAEVSTREGADGRSMDIMVRRIARDELRNGPSKKIISQQTGTPIRGRVG